MNNSNINLINNFIPHGRNPRELLLQHQHQRQILIPQIRSIPVAQAKVHLAPFPADIPSTIMSQAPCPSPELLPSVTVPNMIS